MNENERETLRKIGRKGQHLREQLEKAHKRMLETGSVRDKKQYEEAYRAWFNHVESYRKYMT